MNDITAVELQTLRAVVARRIVELDVEIDARPAVRNHVNNEAKVKILSPVQKLLKEKQRNELCAILNKLHGKMT